MRSRLSLVLLAIGVILCGLAVQYFRAGGWLGDVAGTLLYAALVYVLVLFVRPAIRAGLAFAVTSAICMAIEVAQLSPVPALLSDQSQLLRLIFGTSFAWSDLAAYVIGAAVCALVHLAVRSRRAVVGRVAA